MYIVVYFGEFFVMRQGYNNNNLKYRNRGIVLQLIATEPIYRADITKKIGLTRMAISNIVGELIQEGYIVEKEFEEKGSIGRNPILLDISPTSPLCVGLYISREFLYVVLSDIKLNSLYLDKVKLINENEESLVSKIYMVLEGLFNFYNEKFNNRAILGIGVSCIGPFDPVECVLLNPRDFFGISNLSIKEVIQKKYPYSVFGANDMNGAALAESLMGCGQEFNNFLYLGITHGIGSGVIVNRRLYGRESISSGELGHMTIDYNGNLCTCGKKGCLETYATIPNIINRLQEKCGCENICPEDFESLCLDPCCDEVFCDVTEKLSIALVNAVNMLDPEAIIVGHEGAFLPEKYLHVLRDKIDEQILSAGYKNVKVLTSAFLNYAPLFGSCAIILNRLFLGENL